MGRNAKIWQCLPCGYAAEKAKLVLHIYICHLGQEDAPFRCKLCSMVFVKIFDLNRHLAAERGPHARQVGCQTGRGLPVPQGEDLSSSNANPADVSTLMRALPTQVVRPSPQRPAGSVAPMAVQPAISGEESAAVAGWDPTDVLLQLPVPVPVSDDGRDDFLDQLLGGTPELPRDSQPGPAGAALPAPVPTVDPAAHRPSHDESESEEETPQSAADRTKAVIDFLYVEVSRLKRQMSLEALESQRLLRSIRDELRCLSFYNSRSKH